MYNLLITAMEDAWDFPPFQLSEERFLEHTEPAVAAQFRDLTNPAVLAKVCSMPALFMYEKGVNAPGWAGRITAASGADGNISVIFETDRSRPIVWDDLKAFHYQLGITDPLEMKRRHWAIKNRDLEAILKAAFPGAAEITSLRSSERGVSTAGLDLDTLINEAIQLQTTAESARHVDNKSLWTSGHEASFHELLMRAITLSAMRDPVGKIATSIQKEAESDRDRASQDTMAHLPIATRNARAHSETLTALVGKLRSLKALPPLVPSNSASDRESELVTALRKFRDATHRVRMGRNPKPGKGLTPRLPYPMADEYDVQDVLWAYIKMAFPEARDEDPTHRSGGTFSKMDFYIPSLRAAIEVKFIREQSDVPRFKDLILRDIHDFSTRGDVDVIAILIVEAADSRARTDVLEDLERRVDGQPRVYVIRCHM